jgi:hypothetical protein
MSWDDELNQDAFNGSDFAAFSGSNHERNDESYPKDLDIASLERALDKARNTDQRYLAISDWAAAMRADCESIDIEYAAKRVCDARGLPWKRVFVAIERGYEIHDGIKNKPHLERVLRQASAFEERKTPKKKNGHDWRAGGITGRLLQGKQFPPRVWLVPDYIPQGTTLLAARPKIGKSWLILDVALGAAGDRYTLGTLRPANGDVLYLALEDGQQRLQGRQEKLLGGVLAPERITFMTEWRRANEGGLDDIREWCASVSDPTLIVIDVLANIRAAASSKVQQYEADYAAIKGLRDISNAFSGLSIIVIHHTRKADADEAGDTVSGTLGLNGAADTIIVLKKKNGSVTMSVDGRDVQESETAIQFNKDTCRWTILGDAAEVNRSDQRKRILEALADAPDEGMSIAEIATEVDQNKIAVKQTLGRMKKSGEVQRVKHGRYALPSDSGN